MNPFVGVIYHWLGGLASGSFYVPFRGVKKWSWEVYWLAAGVFSWLIAPWVAALLLTNNLCRVLTISVLEQPQAVLLAFLFGMMWGMGGLTFGLTMRYLGMSLGMAVALGYCTVFGFLMPPIVKGTFLAEILGTTSGNIVLFGVVVCILGIVIAALAGMSKEREMSEDAKKAAIKEFSFAKGLLVATFSGIMSAGMAYGMSAASPIAEITLAAGTKTMWSELPRLCVILAGGFLANFIWCSFLFYKNKTGNQFFARTLPEPGQPKIGTQIETAIDAPGEEVAKEARFAPSKSTRPNVPRFWNYLLCAIAGTTWYLQFFFYSMGETQMGAYQFSSWPLHMASIMIFSSLWGLALHEWRGSSRYTKTVLFVTLFTLILSTVLIGYGTHIGKMEKEKQFLTTAQQMEADAEILALTVQSAGKIERAEKLAQSLVNRSRELAVFADSVGSSGSATSGSEPKTAEQAGQSVEKKRKINGLLSDIGLVDYESTPIVDAETGLGSGPETLPTKGRELIQEMILATDVLAGAIQTKDGPLMVHSAETVSKTVSQLARVLKQ